MGRHFITVLLMLAAASAAGAQRSRRAPAAESEFGPNVRVYLEYLRAEQEVVDDRVSRREIDRGYYELNSNRIRALRQVALRMARASENDYLPELVAVAADEFDQLFEPPLPAPAELSEGETLEFKFRYLGPVASGRHKFYVFARLDPYEQAELRKQAGKEASGAHATTATPAASDQTGRPRRVNAP
ncbi:MAG TPA: hypothetical protein VN228_14905 [Pyrinomonadaceae bacterium]|nr:hypothetical protein [Pyrinomonadaceae bacterium]